MNFENIAWKKCAVYFPNCRSVNVWDISFFIATLSIIAMGIDLLQLKLCSLHVFSFNRLQLWCVALSQKNRNSFFKNMIFQYDPQLFRVRLDAIWIQIQACYIVILKILKIDTNKYQYIICLYTLHIGIHLLSTLFFKINQIWA